MIHLSDEERVYNALIAVLGILHECKPNDRSDADRSYAVAVTELQKLIGFWFVYALYFRASPSRNLDELATAAKPHTTAAGN
jgi:hypothetical protein